MQSKSAKVEAISVADNQRINFDDFEENCLKMQSEGKSHAY